MADEQLRARRHRLTQLALFGFAVSLPFHAILLAWLGTVYLQRPVPGEAGPLTVSLASVVDERLSEIAESLPAEELALETTDSSGALEAFAAIDAPAPTTSSLAPGALGDLALGGAGGGIGGEGLGGGTGGASFFGIGSRGTRFVYIVDVSGSMAEENRFPIAMSELMRSIERLPDNTYFHVIFFSSGASRPAWQEGWLRARRTEIGRMRRWVGEQSPGGGTFPEPAFAMAFALDVPPDVIFFMTDGIIPNSTPREVRSMNRAGRRVAVNTIAFGEEDGHDLLDEIARDSAGAFRFVPTRRR